MTSAGSATLDTASPASAIVTAPTIEHRGPASLRSRLLAAVFRHTLRPLLTRQLRDTSRPPGALAAIERVSGLLRPPRGTRTSPVTLGACDGEWVVAPHAGSSRRVVLYFHGGAFFACGLRSHRQLVARVSAAAGGASVLNVGYRLMPEAQLADIVEDAFGAYRWLLERDHEPEDIVFGGDSSGGFLGFAVALAARDAGLPLPAGIVAISPITDLDNTRRSEHPNNACDPFVPTRLGEIIVRQVAVDGVIDPALSPINADLAGLPPVLIQVGSTEIVLGEAQTMADRLAAAGVACRLQVWDRQAHIFPLLADLVPEGHAAIAEIGAFIDTVTTRSVP